jgi:hypothetical protein
MTSHAALPGLDTSSWTIGWKVANLVIRRHGAWAGFVRIHQSGVIEPYGVDQVASCDQYAGHQAPAENCHCGFNAFADRASTGQLWQRWSSVSTVRLRVALGGKVVEGTQNGWRWGYKAEQQVVTNLYLPPRCHACGDDLHGLPLRLNRIQQFTPDCDYTAPACPLHADATAITSEQLQAYLPGVVISWDTEPATKPAKNTSPWVNLSVNINSETKTKFLWLSRRRNISVQEIVRRAAHITQILEEAQARGDEIIFRDPLTGRERQLWMA